MDFKRPWKIRVLAESSRNRTLWINTFIYESVETKKAQNQTNTSHHRMTLLMALKRKKKKKSAQRIKQKPNAMARYVYIQISWKQKEAKRIKWKPPSTTPLIDLKRHWKKRVFEESSRNQTLWLDTLIYKSVESRKRRNKSNGNHLPRQHYWTWKNTKKECFKNQPETKLYGSIRLYTNQLKAEIKTNQIKATFHDTITGLQKTLGKKRAQRIKQKRKPMAQYLYIRISWKRKEKKRMKWMPLYTAILMDDKRN
jgi:hypothetical protein